MVVVVIIIPAAFLVTAVIEEATRLVANLQVAVEKGEYERWVHPLEIPAVEKAQRWLEERLDLSQFKLEAAIRDTIGQTSSFLAKQSVGIVRNVALGFVQLALTLVTLFFLLRDSPRLLPSVRAFIPLDDEQTDELLHRVVDTIRATVHGATIVAVTQGTLTGLAFWLLSLPSPLLWGAITTILCFVPLLGSPVVWAPAALLLAAQGIYWKATVLALWGLLVVGLVDNLLRPLVIGTRTRLHVLIVFFSVWGGLLLIGPLGLVLGPVILAVTLALLEVLRLKLAEGDWQRSEPAEPEAGSIPLDTIAAPTGGCQP